MPPHTPLAEQKLLRQRLDAAYAEAAQPLSREDVADIVRSVLGTLQGDMSTEDIRLYKELEGLARYIHDAKREIAAIRPADIKDQHIPDATDELDAVIEATEKATFAIFDACDEISGIAGGADAETSAKLTESVTRIYEACNFQDVTGQRIRKVVKTLQAIEAKVDALVAAFGEDAHRAPVERAPEPAPFQRPDDPDSHLLHGPQLPGAAIDQDEIDRLLASFD